jgi:outer membrane lipoprotein-sorting protein
VPAAVLVAIGGGALAPTLSGAAAPPQLPGIPAQQLVAQVIQAKVPALSGTLTWTANLGLSDLASLEAELGQGGNGSGGDGGGGFSPLSLLSGSYQIDVWLGGPTSEHLALSESAAQEVDLVRNGNQVWLWDSATASVTHIVAPAAPAGTEPTTTSVPPLTPQELATRFLNHLSPTTSVTVGTPLYVAGQPAYQLLVSPKAASGSTVNHIEIDVGASGSLQGVPLQVAIYANGQASAALELGFTGQVTLGPPPASELTFTPPPGATVTTHDLKAAQHGDHSFGNLDLSPIGSGWSTVLSGNDPKFSSTASSGVLDAATTVVEVGGQQARLFSTDLFNALVLPDGHFYAGFVTPAVLEATASSSS